MSTEDELYTALRRAVEWADDIGEVRGVLHAGLDPNYTPNASTYCPPVLHVAATAYGLREEKVRCLVTEGGCDVNILDSYGLTALMVAQDRLSVVAELLALRADPNIISQGGSTALSKAAGRASLEVVNLLLEHAIDRGAADSVPSSQVGV